MAFMNRCLLSSSLILLAALHTVSADFERVGYHHPGLEVDLGVGLWGWPLPMDWDGDGDFDLVVSCPDVPFAGIYWFENPEGPEAKMPVFKPPVRVGDPIRNVQLSIVDDRPVVMSPGREWTDFLGKGFQESTPIDVPKLSFGDGRTRADQWKRADVDGDGRVDLVVGTGYWGDYGWDDAWNAQGEWTNGPLHGYVHWFRQREDGSFAKPQQVHAGGKPVDVYGMPSPNMADWDRDGDLDLLCGEFLDGFTYFENTGTATAPVYAVGKRLLGPDGKAIAMDVQMITPVAIDWDRDGDIDLVVGDEDGRVALVENLEPHAEDMPKFAHPRYFQQQARDLKFGALVTPVSTDWDGDGDEDLICGNTAGHIAFIENLDGGNPPRWARPTLLKAGGEELRILAGPQGSIQGPCEAKWGYTTLDVADWNGDQLPDLIVNSIWGKVVWFRNMGTRTAPMLDQAVPIEIAWTDEPKYPAWNWWQPDGNAFCTQWRTSPVVLDWDNDKRPDIIMLDHEGYLAWFRRREDGRLDPGQRRFHDANGPLKLAKGDAGKSGRRKLCFTDWDGDGKLDLFVNSTNVDLYLNRGQREDGIVQLEHQGPLGKRRLAGHTTSPTTVDWDSDGRRDLLVGAEDGRFYLFKRP